MESFLGTNMMKQRSSWLWTLLCFCLTCSLPSATQAQPPIVITTSDPQAVNDETNAYVFAVIESSPPEEPIILRVDQIADVLVQHALETISDPETQVQFVANGLTVTSIWQAVIYDDRTGDARNLVQFAASLLGLADSIGMEPYPNFLESREEAIHLETNEGRNFTAETLSAYQAVVTTYNDSITPFGFAPFYQISYGYETATNAQTVGYVNGRCFVYLNLGARRMLQLDVWNSAIAHETWHCFQASIITPPTTPLNLWQTCLREGVAMYLTSLVDPTISQPDLLFWSQEEYNAAVNLQNELVTAFGVDRLSKDSSVTVQWYDLSVSLVAVPGAPTRCGYFVGLLAVQAYATQTLEEEQQVARVLLQVSETPGGQEEIWQALMATTDTSQSGPTAIPLTGPTASGAMPDGGGILLSGLVVVAWLFGSHLLF